jgi:arginyl-tRNA synthetase
MKEFPANKYLVVVGDEQRLHFQQLVKTLELIGLNKNSSYNFLTFGMVRLPTGKMSSRTGDNILYSDFMKEMKDYTSEEIKKRDLKISEKELEKRALAISISAIKYSMLKQDSNKVIVFDKQEALSFEGNSGPYILYSYARANSIIKKSPLKEKINSENINDSEKSLINELSKFPEVVEHANKALAPNLIANYAFALAQKFNEFYHSNQVIGSEQESFRLSLVKAFIIVIRNSLNLLGIPVIEKM